jgi:hypothetical protein
MLSQLTEHVVEEPDSGSYFGLPLALDVQLNFDGSLLGFPGNCSFSFSHFKPRYSDKPTLTYFF